MEGSGFVLRLEAIVIRFLLLLGWRLSLFHSIHCHAGTLPSLLAARAKRTLGGPSLASRTAVPSRSFNSIVKYLKSITNVQEHVKQYNDTSSPRIEGVFFLDIQDLC